MSTSMPRGLLLTLLFAAAALPACGTPADESSLDELRYLEGQSWPC